MGSCRGFLFSCALLLCGFTGFSQDASGLLQKVRAKLDLVDNYVAEGFMKTNVSFLKVPEALVTVYFKKPDKLKIKNDKGISLLPKGAVSIGVAHLLKGGYTALDGGTEIMGGKKIKIIKLLPLDENADIVLSTLYIDEADLLIVKARTTTRENGSYEVEMFYGRYAVFALPDKLIFTFNTKDYKLPKGITFDYDDGSKPKAEDKTANTKGRVELSYSSYLINKGLSDTVFQ